MYFCFLFISVIDLFPTSFQSLFSTPAVHAKLLKSLKPNLRYQQNNEKSLTTISKQTNFLRASIKTQTIIGQSLFCINIEAHGESSLMSLYKSLYWPLKEQPKVGGCLETTHGTITKMLSVY